MHQLFPMFNLFFFEIANAFMSILKEKRLSQDNRTIKLILKMFTQGIKYTSKTLKYERGIQIF